jgi:hypothetical protein
MSSNGLRANLDKFDRYVMNDIPIRLIRLSDMKFVTRNDVRNHFQSFVPQAEHSSYQPRETVKYAILSHRWLSEGELTYHEAKEGAKAGPGYEKLKKFCNSAKEYNVQFAWADTCCIDKTSSTELDESIRSMFRWYRNSTICIIHLAKSRIVSDIPDDEWMRRGWTLQELLAPYKIKFFNKHWIPMTANENDKRGYSTLLATLEKATNIPWKRICEFKPGPFEVDKRMTWAAGRKTTRVEDVAYSLMGIFGVSLQIAYGEGGDLAFCRLIEAIMQGGDPSVLNWANEAAKHHTSRAIPRSPQSFVGHRELKFDGVELEMTMTSLGLRVPLVIFPLDLYSTTSILDGRGGICIILRCPLCPTINISIIVSNPGFRPEPYQYALGIVNYSLINDKSCEVLGIRGKSGGFILSRAPNWLDRTYPAGHTPGAHNFVGLKFVSPPEEEFTKWNMLLHGLVEVDFPDMQSELVFYIDREYLRTVYL